MLIYTTETELESFNAIEDNNGPLTTHRYFAPTACPSNYLYSKFSYIANEVNQRLQKKSAGSSPITPTNKLDDAGNPVWINGLSIFYFPEMDEFFTVRPSALLVFLI